MIPEILHVKSAEKQTPSSSIKTPQALEFAINPNQLSNMISAYAHKEYAINNGKGLLGKFINTIEADEQIESDTEFISKILEIAAKSEHLQESLSKQNCIKNNAKILSDQQCVNIDKMGTKHAQSNKFNEYSAVDLHQIPKQKVCQCCQRAEGQPLPFCENQTQKYFFGPAIILYFFIIRKLLILITITACIYGIFSITTNILISQQNDQQINAQCSADILGFLCYFKVVTSVRNKSDLSITQNQQFMQIQLWLGLIACIIWVLGIRIVRTMGRFLNIKIDHELDSSSDYCIQISNLPYSGYSQEQLLKYLAKLWRTYKGKQSQKLSIKSVQIIYNLSPARKLITEIIQSSNNLVGMLSFDEVLSRKSTQKQLTQLQFSNIALQQKNQQTQQQMTDSIQQQDEIVDDDNKQCVCLIRKQSKQKYYQQKSHLMTLLKQLQEFRDKFINDSKNRSQYSTDMTLIQFSDSEQQTQFLKKIRQFRTTFLSDFKDKLLEKCFTNQQSILFHGDPIKITRAPEPSDIHWTNCETKQSFKRIVLVWGITFGVIGLSFGMLMFIKFLRNQFPALNQMTVIISVSLQLFNRIIWNVLCSCIQLEQNNTKTDNIMSIMNKSMLAQTINITVLPIIMNVVLSQNIYGSQGLIGMTLDYQIVVLMMMLNINIVNVPYQFKRIALCIPFIRNFIIRKKSQIVGELDTIEQIKEVLKFYQPPEFPIAGGYIYMTAVIYHALFFVHLQPALLFFLIINIGSFYLVNKYLLLRRCKIAQLLDFIIFETSCSLLQHAVLIYGIGTILFLRIISQTMNPIMYIPSGLCILLWFTHMMNPYKIMQKITKCLIQLFFSYYSKQKEQQNVGDINMADNSQHQNQLIGNIMKSSFMQKKMTKRRQCYYKNSGTNDLLNYESKLIQIKNNENSTQKFCQRFQLNPIKQVFDIRDSNISGIHVFKSICEQGKRNLQLPPISQIKNIQGVKVPKNIYKIKNKCLNIQRNQQQEGHTNTQMNTNNKL